MQHNKIYRLQTASWPIERLVFLIAGLFVLAGSLFTLFFNAIGIYFILLVGLMLINFSLTGYCPLAILLGYLKKNS